MSSLDDATRSRLANLMHRIGGGRLTLYAVSDRQQDVLILVVSNCAEEALKLIRENVGLDWNVGNTVTRSVQRNVDAEPEIITAFKVHRHQKAHTMKQGGHHSPPGEAGHKDHSAPASPNNLQVAEQP